MYTIAIVALLCTSLVSVDAHMRLIFPAPRGHPTNVKYQPIDYDLVAPLFSNPEKTFPCGGKTKKGDKTASFKAGETITVQLEGGATHNGGHCQFALSCNGKNNNFVVIKSVLNTCPIEKSYPVQIPAGASGDCVFSWTWVNHSGNRELYQNCADVHIDGPEDGSFSGPPLTILNIPKFDTMPEGGAAPYNEAGVPNFRYGEKSTEGYVKGFISSRRGNVEHTAPPAPVQASNPVSTPVKPAPASVNPPSPSTSTSFSSQSESRPPQDETVTISTETIKNIVKKVVNIVSNALNN